jgi:hypothetical protein
MLLCGIMNALKKSPAKTGLLAFFFCQANDSRINTATAVLRALFEVVNDRFVAGPGGVDHVRVVD